MSEQKMGKWAHPPLAYVVAEAVISPHYTVSQFIAAIQQSLRETYPRTIDGVEISIDFAGSSPSPVQQSMWQLLTPDNSRGIHIGTRAIALHATHYEDFPEFNNSLRRVLEAVESSGLNPFVERLGLRYIDYILPSEGHEPRDYLVPSLRGVTPSGAAQMPQASMWVSAFPFDSCTVNARIAAPAPPGNVMPPNFAALPLAKPKTMEDAEERAKSGSPIGFIDTDCTQAIGQTFNASTLASKFSAMHDYISTTFRSFMSPLAEKEWVK